MSGLSHNDEYLIQLLHEGDEQALSLIYKKYWEVMYVAAYNLVKNKEISEDIVQDVFVNLWNKRDKLLVKTSLKSYLYTSTIYKVYDFFRKNNKMIEVELVTNFNEKIQALTPETQLMHKELIQHVESVIDELPEKCKEVFRLSREEGLSNKAIAAQLNISLRTVEGHISKALRFLRMSLSVSLSIDFIFFLLKNK
ncbi:RNA polymerase sigma-70 factor [Tamlana sp. s12]|uniref:RNA polymerase sigma factor n=1 Tax=Tamlana sp. s12 TaxID=1630406 RepID=UPI0009EF3847|nr:RNA polymerase sigma-70 factor [Tamlana sp. s12]QQY82126.1 RNA polymerase sigma-70 factor [Tamlana sp. s12]